MQWLYFKDFFCSMPSLPDVSVLPVLHAMQKLISSFLFFFLFARCWGYSMEGLKGDAQGSLQTVGESTHSFPSYSRFISPMPARFLFFFAFWKLRESGRIAGV